ncbi:hypothetical protein FRB99_007321 [Tulasnella sp. 403]|nr:hypothetical protein FRB99_007321 [Tulasnella sp. 403]
MSATPYRTTFAGLEFALSEKTITIGSYQWSTFSTIEFLAVMGTLITLLNYHLKKRMENRMEAVTREAVSAFLAGDVRFEGPELSLRERAEIHRRITYYIAE